MNSFVFMCGHCFNNSETVQRIHQLTWMFNNTITQHKTAQQYQWKTRCEIWNGREREKVHRIAMRFAFSMYAWTEHRAVSIVYSRMVHRHHATLDNQQKKEQNGLWCLMNNSKKLKLKIMLLNLSKFHYKIITLSQRKLQRNNKIQTTVFYGNEIHYRCELNWIEDTCRCQL